ncbi:dihydroxy-acid dehydratase [Ureibacillus composti]|nr:dihydroxy-acid dehydratase [Ureibacillus composti]
MFPVITNEVNPYRDQVQGKANEPITVAGLLDQAKQYLGRNGNTITPTWTLHEICLRLEKNAPRIAIIGGSADHPAHILDFLTVSHVALRIWENGGIPFYFSTPVMCDGTAQSNQGMSYSLQSRNAVAQMIVNQLESHSYHAAVVLQGCDKQPLGVVSGLAHLDRLRKERNETPFIASFIPAHVLQGGTIPEDVVNELKVICDEARKQNLSEIAEDIEDAMSYILQCSSNTAFQGVLERAVKANLIDKKQHKSLELRLAASTCDSNGGICAFNGTGNSSRHIVAGLGLIHPSVELLTQPPTQQQVNQVVDAFSIMLNKEEYGVSSLVQQNIKNAIKIHSSSGGSTNLMIHIVSAMIYAGFDFSLFDIEDILNEYPVPDLFNYSLTEDRDIFSLAIQCCSGQSRGMESLFFELLNNNVPMDTNAFTVTGQTWSERLENKTNLSALNVKNNPIILNQPRRPFSGIDVLRGNFFESAIVKISGMPTQQLNTFDNKLSIVLYFDNEDEANQDLLSDHLLSKIERAVPNKSVLLEIIKYNSPEKYNHHLSQLTNHELFEYMISEQILKITVMIGGQGPAAFGMPEMFTPMQHINANRVLKRMCTLISDGRYSGVTYGAAIGHVTPESFNGGGIGYIKTGDILLLQIREKAINLIDVTALTKGNIQLNSSFLNEESRQILFNQRIEKMKVRQKLIAASNRLTYHSDAARGVVPQTILEEANVKFTEYSVIN